MSIFTDLRPPFDRLLERYHGSATAAFLRWWGGELYRLLPAGVRQRMIAPRPQLWLLASPEDLTLQIWQGALQPAPLDTLGGTEDRTALRQRWASHQAGFTEGPPEVTLLLPAELVLQVPVELPLAAEANLAQAVSYQLDQLTPFRADQVWHAFRVVHRDTETGRLKLDLRLIQRQRLDPLIQRLDAIGIRPHIVDAVADPASDEPVGRAGFNLLPSERRKAYINRRVRLNWGLATATVALLFAVMLLSVQFRIQGLEQLRTEVNLLRAEADRVMALQRELDDALDAANFLADHRREQPVILHVLDELTRVLPNDLWLQQVQVRERELSLQGSGNGSQRLIELINGSGLFSDTEFRGAVNIDPNTGQERFAARATITPWGAQHAVAARSEP